MALVVCMCVYEAECSALMHCVHSWKWTSCDALFVCVVVHSQNECHLIFFFFSNLCSGGMR